MADLKNSEPPGTHHLLPRGGAGGPQVLRPAPNRHFPLPSSSSLLPGVNLANAAANAAIGSQLTGDKPWFLAGSPAIKPVTKIEEENIDESAQTRTDEGKKKTGSHILKESTVPGVKLQKQQKASKVKRCKQEMHTVDGLDPSAVVSRSDSSLSLLTRKFVRLLQNAKDGTLDLNEAAVILEVQKRRIYDITNVLEGIGLLDKVLKNKICWKKNTGFGPLDQEKHVIQLKIDNGKLCEEEGRIDEKIREMQDKLQALTRGSRHKFLYVTKEDITSLRCFQHSTLFAIEAPRGTCIEVLNPYEDLDFPQKRYEMYLRSSVGPISCNLICEDTVEVPSQDQPVPMSSSIKDNFCNRNNHASCCDDHDNALSGQSQDDISSQGGLLRLTPPDCDCDVDDDYWFHSDEAGSLTDIWDE